jgi:hypothetical protein
MHDGAAFTSIWTCGFGLVLTVTNRLQLSGLVEVPGTSPTDVGHYTP